MAICSATTACASKNASLTSGLRSVEKLSPTIGTTNRPFTGILPLSQQVAHAHCLSRATNDQQRPAPPVHGATLGADREVGLIRHAIDEAAADLHQHMRLLPVVVPSGSVASG